MGAKRAGRPWSPARGGCAEINHVVEVVRSWLDESLVTVAELHRRLTAEHFRDGAVPTLRKLRDQLSGEALAWELVEAVADVCFPHESALQARERLAPVRGVWQVARTAPSGTADALPSAARELLRAKEQTIAAYQEIDRLRQALQASEHGRLQALQAATLVFAMLGQAEAQVASLQRQVDALRESPALAPAQAAAVDQRLRRAVAQEQELRRELARAERDRGTAQQVADHAARRIQALEAEIARLRTEAPGDQPQPLTSRAADLPQVRQTTETTEDATLDDVDRTLDEVRSVLNREHEAVQAAAEEVGWRPVDSGPRHGPAVVPGQVVATAPGGLPEEVPGLSGTTGNNPSSAGHSGAGVPARLADVADAQRTRYIGAATRRIARGVDLDEIVLGLCRATVPTFADAILVYLRHPLPAGDERPRGPVRLRLWRTEGVDAEKPGGRPTGAVLFPELGHASTPLVEVRRVGPLAKVLRGGCPLLNQAPAVEAALCELLGPDIPMPGGHRVILAPLRGRHQVLGVVAFLRSRIRPAFAVDDLLVAAQLATHTALGVDKAVLYGREGVIADALQRTMLPASLPQPAGVRLASRYLPATDRARMGGDWYDAVPLPGSRVALVVGDVMGHFMTSAAIMGQLRTTAQMLAGLDLPPQEVLHQLDLQAQRLGADRIATCLYAVYDPVAHRIVVANAGHPPPVMLHRGGRAEVLRVPPGAPIGVGGVDFEAVELDAPAGATLVLYTDGLVESRVRDVWTGIEQLRERLTRTAREAGGNPPPLEPLCDDVLDVLGTGDHEDDIALLAARFDGITSSDVAYWCLDPGAQAAGQARRLARRALARWGLEDLTDQLELLVSEVVTNAVRYAERPITLRLLRTDVLRCEVGDDVPQLPRLRQARPSDEGGRGLYLVNRLAWRWGATRVNTGKVVWFECLPPVGPGLDAR
ncbi:SpoIIE family protein phosphatase [Streptomyces sp. NPDC003077]|uniref:SpoIIE family protein phosphatase n=1 Tax=Streptomyces sp. NPDC003077 TaxID=3154443 RepID=UPI0033BBD62E